MKTIKQIVLFGLAFVVTLFLCEVFLRNTEVSQVSFSDYYDDIGKGYRKNQSLVNFTEGFGVRSINEYRYIGEALPPERKPNTLRIALLGDSYVESLEIFERDYFGNIAEGILSDIYTDKEIEIMNFGRSSFNIGNMYAYQKLFVDEFKPDVVVYMLSNSDLIPNYTTVLLPESIVVNDSLIISTDFNKADLEAYQNTKFLTQNSAVLNMLNKCRRKAKETPIASVLFGKSYDWFNAPLSHIHKQGAEGGPFIINPITEKIIQNLDAKKVIIVNRDNISLPDSFVKLCHENGLYYFDLSTTLRGMNASGDDPNYWSVTKKNGHWNHPAHKMIGDRLAKYLRFFFITHNPDLIERFNRKSSCF